MNQKEQNEEMEIDLLDLAYMLLDNWHYLLICSILVRSTVSEWHSFSYQSSGHISQLPSFT